MVARVRLDGKLLQLSLSKLRFLVGGHWEAGSRALVQCIVHPAGSSHMVSAPKNPGPVCDDLSAYACMYVSGMLISVQ